jgi:hypothetical protein
MCAIIILIWTDIKYIVQCNNKCNNDKSFIPIFPQNITTNNCISNTLIELQYFFNECDDTYTNYFYCNRRDYFKIKMYINI